MAEQKYEPICEYAESTVDGIRAVGKYESGFEVDGETLWAPEEMCRKIGAAFGDEVRVRVVVERRIAGDGGR